MSSRIYTVQMVEELKKCSESFEYFLEAYAQLHHPVHGSTAFQVYQYNLPLVENIHERRMFVEADQSTTKTALIALYFTWHVLFRPHSTLLYIGKDAESVKHFMDAVRHAYDHVPTWLVPPTKYRNKHVFETEIGAKVIGQVASLRAGRGLTANLVFIDELAFFKPSALEAVWTSLIPIFSCSKHCQVIVSSTTGEKPLEDRVAQFSKVGFKHIRLVRELYKTYPPLASTK